MKQKPANGTTSIEVIKHVSNASKETKLNPLWYPMLNYILRNRESIMD